MNYAIHPKDFHTVTIRPGQITTAGTPYVVNKQFPDRGFRIISIRPEVYTAAGRAIAADDNHDRITVSVQQQTSPNILYTESPIDIFMFTELEDARLWEGWYFQERAQTTWTFTATQFANDFPYDVWLHCAGYYPKHRDD